MFRFVSAALVSLPALCLADPAANGPVGQADLRFRRGVELAANGEFGAAVRDFEAAFALSPHPAVLYNLGQAYSRSGRPVEALAALERYLAELPDVAAERRRTVEELIRLNQGRIGWVRIQTNPATATVLIDGRELRGLEDGRIALGEGAHVVLVHAKGHDVASKSVSIRPTETTTLVMNLTPSAAAPRHGSNPAAPSRARSGLANVEPVRPTGSDASWLKYPLIVGGGALALAGGVTYLVNSQRYAAFREEKRAWSSNVPLQPDPAWSVAGQRLEERQDNLRTVDLAAMGLLGAGLAANAAGLAIWLVSSRPHEKYTPTPRGERPRGPRLAVSATRTGIEVRGQW